MQARKEKTIILDSDCGFLGSGKMRNVKLILVLYLCKSSLIGHSNYSHLLLLLSNPIEGNISQAQGKCDFASLKHPCDPRLIQMARWRCAGEEFSGKESFGCSKLVTVVDRGLLKDMLSLQNC